MERTSKVEVKNAKEFKDYLNKVDIPKELSALDKLFFKSTKKEFEHLDKGSKVSLDSLITLTEKSSNLDILDLLGLLIKNKDTNDEYSEALEFIVKEFME